MRYIDGFLIPVPTANREAYLAMAKRAADVFLAHGALRVVEAWGDDVPDGHTTDFKSSVKLEAGETVVFSWIEWPSKTVRDEGMKASMADERLKDGFADMPFDGKRMIFGGFLPILDLGTVVP